MQDAYLKTRKTVEERLLISEKLSQHWNFPNMIGAVDRKHVILQQPCNSRSHYRNYKDTDSIILIAVGPEYQFLFADSDGGNWLQSPMRKALEKNTLSLPKPKPLYENRKETPFDCIGDDAFPLTNYPMKPYPQKDLAIDNRIFIIVCRVPDEFRRTLLVFLPIGGECCANLFHCNQKR